jgi:hypothetical protein
MQSLRTPLGLEFNSIVFARRIVATARWMGTADTVHRPTMTSPNAVSGILTVLVRQDHRGHQDGYQFVSRPGSLTMLLSVKL